MLLIIYIVYTATIADHFGFFLTLPEHCCSLPAFSPHISFDLDQCLLLFYACSLWITEKHSSNVSMSRTTQKRIENGTKQLSVSIALMHIGGLEEQPREQTT